MMGEIYDIVILVFKFIIMVLFDVLFHKRGNHEHQIQTIFNIDSTHFLNLMLCSDNNNNSTFIKLK